MFILAGFKEGTHTGLGYRDISTAMSMLEIGLMANFKAMVSINFLITVNTKATLN